MEVTIKQFGNLSLEELYQLLQLRSEVFVVEQNCLYQDIDGKDRNAFHALGMVKGQLVAYTRIFKPGDYFDYAAVGRVVVKNSCRKYGYGKVIMLRSLEFIKEDLNALEVALSAQTYLKRFYWDLGFTETGGEYLEDGIPHIKMVKRFAAEY